MISKSISYVPEISELATPVSDTHISVRSNNENIKRIMTVISGRLFRDGINRVLQSADRQIIGNFETLHEAAKLTDLVAPPDLFVVSIGPSDCGTESLAGIRALRAAVPTARWIVLCSCNEKTFLKDVAESGIDGLLLGDSSGELLQLVTDLVLLGHYCVPAHLSRPGSARSLSNQDSGDQLVNSTRPAPLIEGSAEKASGDGRQFGRFNGSPSGYGSAVDHAGRAAAAGDLGRKPIALSDRETEIMHCLVGGHSNKLIARELGISEATVKVHIKALLRKMRVANRTQAAICALSYIKQPKDQRPTGNASSWRPAEKGNEPVFVSSGD